MAEAASDTQERMLYPSGDTPKPAPNSKVPRIYGHNLCPFTARTRYTFSAKAVPFQECIINLNGKAQWHLDFNGGFTPILETPSGDLIPESGIVMSYGLEANASGGIQLIPADALEAA